MLKPGVYLGHALVDRFAADLVASHALGIGLYAFRYVFGGGDEIGVMADEVRRHYQAAMATAGRVVTDWVGDPGAVTEYNVRFTAIVPVPNDGVGADIVFTGRVKSVDEDSKSVTIALTATHDGKKIFGRAVAIAKLA